MHAYLAAARVEKLSKDVVELKSRGPDDHSNVTRGNRDFGAGGYRFGRRDQVSLGCEVQGWHGQTVRDIPPTHAPGSESRSVGAEQLGNQFSCGIIREGFALIRPFLELHKPACFGAFRVKLTELGKLADGALGIQRPECGLQYFHGQCAKTSRGRFGVAPHVLQCSMRAFGISGEVPRGCKSNDALDWKEVCRGNRHCAAKAIADETDGFIKRTKERKQELFNVSGDRQFGPFAGFSPVQQYRPAPHPGDRPGQGNVIVEIENTWRIDEGGNQHDARSSTAVIAKRRAAYPRDFRSRAWPLSARRTLISAQAIQRMAGQSRLAQRHLAYQFEKERQRPRCAFMLQCTTFE